MQHVSRRLRASRWATAICSHYAVAKCHIRAGQRDTLNVSHNKRTRSFQIWRNLRRAGMLTTTHAVHLVPCREIGGNSRAELSVYRLDFRLRIGLLLISELGDCRMLPVLRRESPAGELL